MGKSLYFSLNCSLCTLLLATLLISCATVQKPQIEVGHSAPIFTAKDFTGRTFSLSDYPEKNIVLVFYIGHRWQPCFQQLGELQKSLSAIRDLQTEVIAVASSSPRDVEMTQKALDVQFILIPGPNADLMKEYAAYNFQKSVALPVTIIIDKNRIVRWKYVGKNDFDRPEISKLLAELQKLK